MCGYGNLNFIWFSHHEFFFKFPFTHVITTYCSQALWRETEGQIWPTDCCLLMPWSRQKMGIYIHSSFWRYSIKLIFLLVSLWFWNHTSKVDKWKNKQTREINQPSQHSQPKHPGWEWAECEHCMTHRQHTTRPHLAQCSIRYTGCWRLAFQWLFSKSPSMNNLFV